MVTRLYQRLHMTHWPTACWLRVVIVSVGVIASILPTVNAASTDGLAAQGAAHPLITHIQLVPARSAHTSALPAITATLEQQATTVPTSTPPSQPTATPQATVTPQPTATPQPSATPQPTSTAQPTATPRPEPTVVPTATPISTVNNANAGFAILSVIVLLLCFVVIGLIVWLVARRNVPVAVPPQEHVAQGLPGSYVPPADPQTTLSPEVYPGVVEPNGSNSTTVPGGVVHVHPQPDTTQPNPLPAPSPGAPGSPSSDPTSDKIPKQQE